MELSECLNILLSVVAIIIVIWSSHSTSKKANEQIAELKQLSKLQIETSIKQVEVEIQKMMAEVKNLHTPHLHFRKYHYRLTFNLKQYFNNKNEVHSIYSSQFYFVRLFIENILKISHS